MNNNEIKKKLIEICRSKLQEKVDFFKKAMDEEQTEANEHKGAMESRYDTFKEEAQARKDGYAKQLSGILQTLYVINEISLTTTETVKFGSVVETKGISYFISTGLLNDKLNIDEHEYIPISPSSPIGQLFLQRKIGDEVEFRGRKIEIINVF